MCIQPCDFNTTYQCKITNYNRTTIVLNYSRIVCTSMCSFCSYKKYLSCLKSRNVKILGSVYVGVATYNSDNLCSKDIT